MEKQVFEKLGETLYTEVLENGLTVHVVPKPEFGKSYAFFATRYGGMDTKFCLDGHWYDTPAGIAHYLEHKMFDTEDGNALQELAANGASPNAFTSNAIGSNYALISFIGKFPATVRGHIDCLKCFGAVFSNTKRTTTALVSYTKTVIS